MADLKVFLLGTPRIEFAGKPIHIERRKALALVAYLAMEAQPQSRDVVANLLWSNLDRDRARATLRSTLPALTRVVPLNWLEANRTTLALKSDTVWIDAQAFLNLLSRSRSHGHGSDTVCPACVDLFTQAIDLYRGDFLTGFGLADSTEFDNWQRTQREWLQRELAGMLRHLAYHYAESKQFDEAINCARHWLTLDVLHEPAHRLLIRLYAATGQRSDALRQYQQCVDLLESELATPPEEETMRLYEAIQGNQPTTSQIGEFTPAVLTSVLPALPTLIVGREEALQDIKHRLGVRGGTMRPVTVIQGWPGVGKSTLVALLAHDADIVRQFPDGILWTSLGEMPNLQAAITAWAYVFNLSEPGQVRKWEDITAQLAAVLRDKRVLLLVDDVWQVQHSAPFRVGGQLSATVLTSRLNDVATALAPTANDVYRLPVLTEDAAQELLARLAPETVAEHANEVRELARDLEGLPLAIQVAGRLLHSEARLGWGVSELLAELRSSARLLKAQAPSDMVDSNLDTSPTVAALLKRSTDALDAETRQRFAWLGLFASRPATFDLQAMAVAWDITDPKPTARLLVNRGLLEPLSGGRFQMHALLVLHARSLPEDKVVS